MDTSNTNTHTQAIDTVAQDFRTSLFIVSLVANLAVFVGWLALAYV